jgi:hypothetical protein
MTSYFAAPTPDEVEPTTANAEFEGDGYPDSEFDSSESVDDDGPGDQTEASDNLEVDDFVDEAELSDLDRLDQPVSATVAQGSLFSSSTGDPRVDGAVSRLADLSTSDITEHPAVLEDVHRRLYDALADLDK